MTSSFRLLAASGGSKKVAATEAANDECEVDPGQRAFWRSSSLGRECEVRTAASVGLESPEGAAASADCFGAARSSRRLTSSFDLVECLFLERDSQVLEMPVLELVANRHIASVPIRYDPLSA